MKAREVNAKILRAGGVFVRQRGSHRIFQLERDGQRCSTSVQQHSGDIPKGTLAAIERDLAPILGKGWLK